ncbi:unnamed protein product [Closterium sp. NIES-53]
MKVVLTRYSTPVTVTLGRHILPFLFPDLPSFARFPRSSLRPVAAEPGGVPAAGTGGPGGVGGGGAGSGGAGAGGTGTVAPTPRTVCFLTREQRLLRLEREERERFERAQQQQQSEQSQSQQQERVEEEVAQESRSQQWVQLQPQQERVEEEPQEQQEGQVPSQQTPKEAERHRLRLRDLPDPAPARLVRGPLPSPPVPPVQSLSSSQRTRRSPLSRAVSPEPGWSRYHADGPFHLILRSRVSPPPVLPQPPDSSLTVLHDPLSNYLRASRPVVSRVLSALVTHPTAPLSSVSALVTTVAGFASSHRLDYAAHLLGFLAASVPHLCAMLLAPEGDPDALDIPIPRTHAEAVSGPWASYWIAVEEAKMASYRSTGTYVDSVPPPGTNVVSGMWLYMVKRSPGSPPVFKARYVARGFSQRKGVDFFENFAPTPKMTTLRVLLHITAQHDYELHSLDFSTAFLQGSLHEQIRLRRPLGFTGSFPPRTQWQLRRPVYGLHQAPREWLDTLRMTLAAFDFFPSSANPSLFVRCGSTPFFVLVYVDNLVFATPDRHALAFVKEELQRRRTCIDLGELQRYLGLQITRDRAARTITLTQSHMVEQILTQFRFPFSKVQLTPLGVDHGLTAPPSDELFEFCSPYPELVGCLMVAKYVASTSGMGLVLGGKQPITLTGFSDSSWADDAESMRSTQGYCFSLGIGAVSWRSTRASSVSNSRCEAEVYAAAMAAQELRWLTFLLINLGERPRSPQIVFADNKSAVLLCEEPRLVGKARHIQLRYFLLRELQQRARHS